MCVVSQGQVKDILYRGAPEEIFQARRPDGKVPLVCVAVSLCLSKMQRYRSAYWSESTIDETPACLCVCLQTGVRSRLFQLLRLWEAAADSRHSSVGRLHLPGPGLRSSAPSGKGHADMATRWHTAAHRCIIGTVCLCWLYKHTGANETGHLVNSHYCYFTTNV